MCLKKNNNNKFNPLHKCKRSLINRSISLKSTVIAFQFYWGNCSCMQAALCWCMCECKFIRYTVHQHRKQPCSLSTLLSGSSIWLYVTCFCLKLPTNHILDSFRYQYLENMDSMSCQRNNPPTLKKDTTIKLRNNTFMFNTQVYIELFINITIYEGHNLQGQRILQHVCRSSLSFDILQNEKLGPAFISYEMENWTICKPMRKVSVTSSVCITVICGIVSVCPWSPLDYLFLFPFCIYIHAIWQTPLSRVTNIYQIFFFNSWALWAQQ